MTVWVSRAVGAVITAGAVAAFEYGVPKKVVIVGLAGFALGVGLMTALIFATTRRKP